MKITIVLPFLPPSLNRVAQGIRSRERQGLKKEMKRIIDAGQEDADDQS